MGLLSHTAELFRTLVDSDWFQAAAKLAAFLAALAAILSLPITLRELALLTSACVRRLRRWHRDWQQEREIDLRVFSGLRELEKRLNSANRPQTVPEIISKTLIKQRVHSAAQEIMQRSDVAGPETFSQIRQRVRLRFFKLLRAITVLGVFRPGVPALFRFGFEFLGLLQNPSPILPDDVFWSAYTRRLVYVGPAEYIMWKGNPQRLAGLLREFEQIAKKLLQHDDFSAALAAYRTCQGIARRLVRNWPLSQRWRLQLILFTTAVQICEMSMSLATEPAESRRN